MKDQLYRFYHYLMRTSGFLYQFYNQKIAIALSRGALTSQLRDVQPHNPTSWEFSVFSQNGEDGIIDYLCGEMKEPNYYFIEIGAYDGIECNSAYLAIAKKYSGLMIEGDEVRSKIARRLLANFNIGVTCKQLFVTVDNIVDIHEHALYKNPDVFSLDIDGCDYYIAKKYLELGARPKLFIVEYNSVYGPDKKLTIPYRDDFDYTRASGQKLYYGVSLALWRKLFKKFGYEFVTVDRRGVNAFFVHPSDFSPELLKHLKGLAYEENFNHVRKYGRGWEEQFDLIKDKEFVEIK